MKLSRLKFVLAITTYNRMQYLSKMLDTFYNTCDKGFQWQIVIADDGSTDGTIKFLKKLKLQNDGVHLIFNNRHGVHHQTNTIIQYLDSIEFDLCFKCDDDIEFIKSGWERLYWEAIKRTGYEHLIFYDTRWRSQFTRLFPIKKDGLVCHTNPRNIQGAFFTITPNIIDKVGYFDVLNFGLRGLGHVDYSLRCCRAGFNELMNPFDVDESIAFFKLQNLIYYTSSLSKNTIQKLNSAQDIRKKESFLLKKRIHINYDNALYTYDFVLKKQSLKEKKKRLRFYSKLGNLTRFIFSLLKRMNLKFLIVFFEHVANILIKLGNDIKNTIISDA